MSSRGIFFIFSFSLRINLWKIVNFVWENKILTKIQQVAGSYIMIFLWITTPEKSLSCRSLMFFCSFFPYNSDKQKMHSLYSIEIVIRLDWVYKALRILLRSLYTKYKKKYYLKIIFDKSLKHFNMNIIDIWRFWINIYTFVCLWAAAAV